ncbi:MAG: YsnF/AvaK domain-containing protein [Acidobacteria bacterium]|nr:YsnF/AvaK domain-containing protein [Acidobacteriota bacterium]
MANTTTNVSRTTSATIAGFFRDESKAERAIDELRATGFSDREIGVATPHEERTVGNFWDKLTNRFGKHEHTEEASEFQDSLRESGVPEQQASYFNSLLGSGGVLVTVHAGPERATQALSVLQRNGADVGATSAEWQGAGTSRQQPTSERIQLLGEILRVHKERVSTGTVRLRKEVVTEHQNIEVPTTREELVVERIPGHDREASGSQLGAGEKEIRVPLSEERVRVEKKPVIKEEVQVGKRQVQETKRVSDQVRHEELRTETEGNVKKENLDDKESMDKVPEKTRRTA